MPNSTTAQATAANSSQTATPQALSFANGETYNVSPTGQATGANVQAQNALSNLGVNTYTGYVPTSTTTVSNANKIAQVPGIQNTTNSLINNTGITTNQQGQTVYANGTIYDPTQATSVNNLPPGYSVVNGQAVQTVGADGKTSTGGYYGDTYYAPGQVLPKDVNGNYIQLTQSSPTSDKIVQSLNDFKAQSDSLTQTIIDNIKASYANLISQQEQTNKGQQATTQNALLMGGVTGQGSSAQYAPISSSGIIQAQMSYGLQQIANLQAKENDAIIQAQQAQLTNNFKVLDAINTEISTIRKEKQDAAQKINDQLQEQAQKLADQKLQADKDNAVASLYAQGITDPTEILKSLKAQGLTITSKEVNDAISNINPYQADINKIALQAAQYGADAQTLAKIQGAKTVGEAIANSGDYLSADFRRQLAQDAFDNKIKQQQVALSAESNSLKRAELNLQIQKEAFDEAQKTTQTVSPQMKQAISKSNIDLVDGLLKDGGLSSSVGPNTLARIQLNPFSGEKQNFIAGVEQMRSQLNLQSLIDAKSKGATFGALSDQELQVLANSATKIGAWAVRDDKGNVIGYNASEKDFKAELVKINNFAKLDYVLKGGSPNDVGIKQQPDGTYWVQNSNGTLTQLE